MSNKSSAKAKSERAAAVLMFLLAAMFFVLSSEKLPEFESLVEFNGTEPGFARIEKTGGKFADKFIHFAENQGINCGFRGPRFAVVERALRPGVSVRILCDMNSAIWNPPVAYEIEIDDQILVSFDEISNYENNDRKIGLWAGLASVLCGLWLVWRNRAIRGGAK